ncbi:MAG: ABC transporter permease [Firmicutes bacterium]|nr:ABC transporter permease [Bacillota bacterium]
MPSAPVASPAGSARGEPAPAGGLAGGHSARPTPGAWVAATLEFLTQTLAVTEAEVRKLRRDPTELFTRAVQPTLWLLVFGNVMGRIRGVPTGNLTYRDFMAPGILAQSALFISIFYGISAIWERDMGILQKFMVSPAPRTALVLGKALSAGVRGLIQALIIYLLALAVGIHARFSPLAILGVFGTTLLGAMVFSLLSLNLACLVRTRERMMGIGQLLTMPLFFASNAIYPLDLMPAWLRILSRINPLTYQVDALRAMMLIGGQSTFGLGVDFGVLALALVLMVWLSARMYPRIVW